MTEQMIDIYGVPCDVQHVRTFQSGSEWGAGYDLRDPSTWFVYDRTGKAERWHMHCGPYSTMEQAVDWINGIREEPR